MTEQEKVEIQSAINTVMNILEVQKDDFTQKAKDNLMLAVKALYFYRKVKDVVLSEDY